MSKIENHSLFGHYKKSEDRVTAALLQILKCGGTEFIGNVISQINEIEFPSSEINITTQERQKSNVYDGKLECNFSFKILVESKIQAESINITQLNGLIENAEKPNDFILYITPDNKKPSELENTKKLIYWVNWKDLNEILKNSKFQDDILNYLILEFEKYLDFLKLLTYVSPKSRVQIAAGSYGEPIAREYEFYACQNKRSIKESGYLAFYNNRGIHSLFKIIGEPQDDTDLSKVNDPSVLRYLKEKEPNYKGDLRQFYKLKFLKELNIKHNEINENGKKTAYTMGVFRYTSIDKIEKAETTKEL